LNRTHKACEDISDECIAEINSIERCTNGVFDSTPKPSPGPGREGCSNKEYGKEDERQNSRVEAIRLHNIACFSAFRHPVIVLIPIIGVPRSSFGHCRGDICCSLLTQKEEHVEVE